MDRFDPARPIAAAMRPMPFWSWNDRLDPEELKRQIREMHRAGLGGFFMHARGGLETEYLGDAWFACIQACVEEAVACDMEPWLYDENGWPSGYAGGRVNGLGEDFQQKYLVCESAAPGGIPTPDTIGCYRIDDGRRIDPAAAAAGREPYYRIIRRVNPCYIDVLNPAATDVFIAATHQYYFDRLPPEIRRAIRGIFTDEPQLAIGKPFYSEYFFAAFRARYGDDPVDRLIRLWYDFPGAGDFRRCYYRLAGELFAANYTAKIHRWCQEHGWLFTGHQVQEVDYAEQTLSSGAVSFHYPDYDMPGIDHLGFLEPDLFVARQMTSVAAQFGQSRRMVEMFACCGWQLTFAGMRWMYQLMQAYGINFLCLHLNAYSLRGLRKRDYPPSFGDHQPWFDDFRRLNDEFARQSQYASTGREFVRTLVIHAQHSVWNRYRLDDRAPEIRRIVTATERLSQRLAELQIPFHYGFEAHLTDHGRIEDGMLVLGDCRYDAVILPELDRLTAPVMRLLRAFPGRVYRSATDEPQSWECPADRAWFEQLPIFESQIRGLFTATPGEALPCLRSSRRDLVDGSLYLIVNRERERSVHARLHWTASHPSIVRLDPATGAATPHPTASDGSFDCELAGGAAWWLWCPRDGVPFLAGTNQPERPVSMRPLPESARIDGGENYLVLDRVRFRIDGGDWEGEEDIAALQWRLLALRRAVRVEIDYPFRLDPGFRPDGPLAVAVETPERFEFALNGNAFAFADTGYLVDRSNRRTRLPEAYLRSGDNRLTLTCVFEQSDAVYRQLDRCGIFETEVNTLSFDLELEALTLIGDFGVRCDGAITDADGTLRLTGPFTVFSRPVSTPPERLVEEGLPFFAGKLTLATAVSIDAAPERFRRFACRPFGLNSIRLAVNGIDCGYCNGEPWQIPLAPGSLRRGENRLTLEVVVPLRNLLGPFHAAAPVNAPVGPGSFARVANPFTHGRIPDYDPAYRIQATGVADWRLTGDD